jgi:hypothetical protein
MPMHTPAQSGIPHSFESCRGAWSRRSALASLAAAFLLPATGICGPQTSSHAQTAPVPLHSHLRSKAKPAPAIPASQAMAATSAPQVPPPPDWPVNDKPLPATVVWDSHGLRIDATNSSLEQILHDVSTDTGAKVEGMRSDERVFGTYGPGPANEVLSQLLNGSGYNVLMIGDQGEGTPRQIMLSARPTGAAPAAHNNGRESGGEEDLEAEQEIREQEMQQQQLLQQEQLQRQQQLQMQQQQQQQNEPPNVRNGFQPPMTPGVPPRTPQQIIQQMQEQQQQQQQQNNQ